jgi:hypothetical protein
LTKTLFSSLNKVIVVHLVGEKRTKPFILLILCLVFSLVSLPIVKAVENSHELWSKTYGGNGKDASTSLVQTSDGGYALAGFTYSSGNGDSDALLVKTDEYGNMEWNKTIGGPDNYSADSLIQTSDGGFAFVGTNSSYYEGYVPIGTIPEGAWSSVWLVKTDEYGNTEWNRTFDSETGFHYGSSLVQTSDGGYALAGHSISFEEEDSDLLLIKTDSYGIMQWSKLYGGLAGESDPQGLIQTLDGGFALVCKNFQYGSWYVDAWFIKTDESGNLEWDNIFGGAGMDYPTSLVQLLDGSFVFAGCTDSYGIGGYDFWLIKTDNYGNMEWNHTFGTQNMDTNPSLVQTLDGGFALAGYTHYDSLANLLLIRTDNLGNMLWNHSYSGGAVLGFPSLVQTMDGGFALSGAKGDFGSGDWDFWLVKTDEYGIPEFPSRIFLSLLIVATMVALVARNKLVRREVE